MDSPAREYSSRLGVLSDHQLQRALDRFGLGRLVDARPAPGGLFGQNVLLATSQGGFVLRGCPYDGQLEKEQYFSRVLPSAIIRSNKKNLGLGRGEFRLLIVLAAAFRVVMTATL